MVNSVKIGDKDMFTDFDCILASKSIEQPSPQTKFVSVPLRDGSIDYSEVLSDGVTYGSRKITLDFLYVNGDIEDKISEISQYMNGKRLPIAFPEDPYFFYEGRISIPKVNRKKGIISFEISAVCDPWKYDINTSDVDWEWDTFDFEEGIINEAGELVVNGEETFTLICRKDREFPEFTVTGSVSMEYDGETYALLTGTHKVYRVFFKKGDNDLKFTGNGTVKISYRGGSL